MSETTMQDVIARVERDLDTPDWSQMRSYHDESEWFGHFIGTLALNVGEDPVVFTDSSVTWLEGESFQGRVVIFTEHTVVIGEAGGAMTFRDADVSFTVTTYPRRELLSLSLRPQTSPYSQNGTEWPGHVSATFAYQGGLSFDLPFKRLREPARRGEFNALLAGLRGELRS